MLNLISDPWIPVNHKEGVIYVRPDQVADPNVLSFAWPRPDLNLACHEFMIGLAFLAVPPEDESCLLNPPDQATFQSALSPLAPAFNLLGDGPRFLQDFEILDDDIKSPDMLFIDSSGDSTAAKNADLHVKRNRYGTLSFPLAAMALFTLQAFAPSGGAGNRTSMRGGGPLVTLVHPKGKGLWPFLYANVPYGEAIQANDFTCLPWMRPTVTSEKEQIVVSKIERDDGIDPEMFFGQPRRLRLVSNGSEITGFIQRPYGAKYAEWVHFLSPYYVDAKSQTLPSHPKPGPFCYRNWRGIILQSDKHKRPANLERYLRNVNKPEIDLIVSGWAMSNMKPLDFLWSEQPVFPLTPDAEKAAIAMIEAAEQASYALGACIRDGTGESGAAYVAKQAFYDKTNQLFINRVSDLSNNSNPDHQGWLNEMRQVAIELFDKQVMPGLSELQETRREEAIKARKSLLGAFSGYGGLARKIYTALDLKLPPKHRGKGKSE